MEKARLMPTLEIYGRRVEVGKEFDKLTPEQQQQTVNEIASQMGLTGRAAQGEQDTGPQRSNIGHKGERKPGDRVKPDLHASTMQGIMMQGADEFAAGVTAPIKALENRMRGEGPTSVSENYNQQKAFLDAQLAATYEHYPRLAPVTEFAGAVMVPGGAGARAAIKAPHLLSKVGRGSAIGAGYGGITGFNSGDGLEDRLQKAKEGAGVGGTVGAMLPVVGAGLGRGYRALTNTFGGTRAPGVLQSFTRAGVQPTATPSRATRDRPQFSASPLI
jgi:hypothetical protein